MAQNSLSPAAPESPGTENTPENCPKSFYCWEREAQSGKNLRLHIPPQAHQAGDISSLSLGTQGQVGGPGERHRVGWGLPAPLLPGLSAVWVQQGRRGPSPEILLTAPLKTRRWPCPGSALRAEVLICQDVRVRGVSAPPELCLPALAASLPSPEPGKAACPCPTPAGADAAPGGLCRAGSSRGWSQKRFPHLARLCPSNTSVLSAGARPEAGDLSPSS